MTEEELAAIEARVQAATPGPWKISFDDDAFAYIYSDMGIAAINQPLVCRFADESDSAFIAAAREGVPKLIAEVRRLQKIERAAGKYCGQYLRQPSPTSDRLIEEARIELAEAVTSTS